MTRLRLRPEDPFALATSIRFLEGLTSADYQSESDQTLDLAAPLRRRGPRSLSHTFPAGVVP